MDFAKHTVRLRPARRFWLVGILSALLVGLPHQNAQAQDYVLGADDVVAVTVLGHPELSAEQIIVSTTGKISLPIAGEVAVSGKTARQIEQEITRRLNKRLVDPEVTVSLKQAREARVFLVGAVAKPGSYVMKAGWRVTEALAAAGGVPGRPDEVSAVLARPNQAPLNVDVQAALADPSTKENQALKPNDVLVLTALEPKKITVSGDVAKPDIYELRRAPRLLDALNAAGGLKQRAQNSHAFVLRQGQKIDVNLTDAIEFRNPTANIEMLPSDLLTVEALPQLRVSVDGRVRNPGNFELENGSGVIQAVAQAGGLTVPPDQIVASVRRGLETVPIDLNRALLEPGADVALKTGDVVLLNEPQIIRIQVTGQVNKPSALRVAPNTTLLDAIAQAGGLSIKPEAARLNVLRTNAPGKQISLSSDAAALLSRHDLTQNITLQEGDLVGISEVKATVAYISGEVLRPGAYELQPGDGIPELIARAGGTTEAAALKKVSLQHGDASQSIDVYGALKEGTERPNVALREGDFVVVPRNEAHVTVMQAVQRPGTYNIPEKGVLTVADAINLAGGPRDRAVIKEVALLRPDAAAPNGVQTKIVSLAKISGGDLSQNVPLQSGDIIYVPEAKAKTSLLGAVGSVIGTLTGLRYLSGG